CDLHKSARPEKWSASSKQDSTEGRTRARARGYQCGYSWATSLSCDSACSISSRSEKGKPLQKGAGESDTRCSTWNIQTANFPPKTMFHVEHFRKNRFAPPPIGHYI